MLRVASDYRMLRVLHQESATYQVQAIITGHSLTYKIISILPDCTCPSLLPIDHPNCTSYRWEWRFLIVLVTQSNSVYSI